MFLHWIDPVRMPRFDKYWTSKTDDGMDSSNLLWTNFQFFFCVSLWMLPNGYICYRMLVHDSLHRSFSRVECWVLQVKAKWSKRCSDDVGLFWCLAVGGVWELGPEPKS